ncbi:MAG: glutamine--fructose-6-phosphate transaminase (isomerizing) [Dehalococcoidia bacterium]|nr:MAG: glutamine--fructose-6-phosphate transaminase (isomerizing) [Dehalococcoidia bacterium]
MCGLIGYSGPGKAAPFILDALKRLEYRGYDSAGIATVSEGRLLYKKDSGKIEEVESKQHLSELPGHVGIGHVRWATHGEVNQVNAHPQLDNRSIIAVVHNGIVENAAELRQQLKSEHQFVSTTDTEVIPFLLAKYLKRTGSMTGAMALAVKELRGPFAFLALCQTEPQVLFACAREMPLLLGNGAGGSIASSDIDSFPEGYREIYALENGEIAVVGADNFRFFDASGNPIHKKAGNVQRQSGFAVDDSLKHHMMREIREEPWAIEQAVIQDEAGMAQAARAVKSAKNVIFTACGTSRHAALMGRYLFSRVGGKLSEVIIGSEFKYFADSINEGSVVIALSQSGETADVLEGVRTARARGAKVISLVNRPSSQLSRLSDLVFPLKCGQENAVAATKSYIAQITVLALLSHYLVGQQQMITEKLKNTVPLVELAYETNLKKAECVAAYIAKFNACYFIARGSNFHIAMEAALKMKEVSYVHGEGMPAGELKHGTLALIEKGTPIVAICPDDYTFEDTIHNVEEAKTRGARIFGVSDRCHPAFNECFRIPKVEEILYPFVTIVPLQELAYFTALARGVDPDRPRNLAKSVTVK